MHYIDLTMILVTNLKIKILNEDKYYACYGWSYGKFLK